MRYIYLLLLAVIVAITVVFIFQNPDFTTITLFSVNFTLPLSLLILFTYVMGIFTGGIVISLLRSLFRRGVTNKQKKVDNN